MKTRLLVLIFLLACDGNGFDHRTHVAAVGSCNACHEPNNGPFNTPRFTMRLDVTCLSCH